MSRLVLLAIGSVILVLLAWLCIQYHIPRMEADIASRTRDLLSGEGLGSVEIEVDGRDVTLRGETTERESLDKAAALVRGVYGVRAVRRGWRVSLPRESEKDASSSLLGSGSLDLRLEKGILTITGQVPDEEAKQHLTEEARGRFGGAQVIANLAFASGLPDSWVPENLQLLDFLAEMISGTIVRGNGLLRVAGVVPDLEKRYQLAKAIHTRWPPPFRVDVGLSLPLQEDAGECQRKIQELLERDPIAFQGESAKFSPNSLILLQKIAKVLTAFPKVNLLITVHSDNEKDPDINLITTRSRAWAIRDYLRGRGIGMERLDAEGYGETRPLAPNDTPPGRALNRRIEFIVLEKRSWAM